MLPRKRTTFSSTCDIMIIMPMPLNGLNDADPYIQLASFVLFRPLSPEQETRQGMAEVMQFSAFGTICLVVELPRAPDR